MQNIDLQLPIHVQAFFHQNLVWSTPLYGCSTRIKELNSDKPPGKRRKWSTDCFLWEKPTNTLISFKNVMLNPKIFTTSCQ